MEPAWLESLLHRLQAAPPGEGLLIAPARQPQAAALLERLPKTRFEHCIPGRLQNQTPRRELALVIETLERLDAGSARILLADLRDRFAHHCLVWVDLGRSALPEAELRALGFRLLARDADQALFGFDLYDYKDRPEWLSAQHWAHPELWDKHRW